MYYAQVSLFANMQNPHAFYGGHTQPSGSPSQRTQGGEYSNSHLVPYLNHSAPHVGGDNNDMNTGAPPSLDAFYIQQASNSFTVPLEVPDVGAYGQATGGSLGPSGLPVRGAPNIPSWAVPSRQSPAGGAHDGSAQDDADVLHQGGNGYPSTLGAGMPPMPGGARSFSATMYRPAETAPRPLMMEQDGARVRPLPKRRRTSPVPFEGVEAQSRFRGALGPAGRTPMMARGPPRRDMDGTHGDGLGELMPEPADSGAPSNDLATWFLGPEGGPPRPHSFPMADPAAYYRSGLAQPPPGLRLDMPGLPATQPHAAMEPKGLPPLRSHAPNSNDEPLYVNAKQYQRILKRRVARARMEEKRRQMFVMAIKQREEEKTGGPANISEEWLSGLLALDEETKKPYLHESRHKHAMRRPRGPGGRFLTTEEIKKRDQELAAQKAQEENRAQSENVSGEVHPSTEAPTSAEAADATDAESS